jgi:hypothetical protein
VLLIGWFIFGILFARMGRFLTDYDGPWGIKLAVVLGLWAVLGLLIWLSRRFYKADELEHYINREALTFAFYTAMAGLAVLYQLQAAGFVPEFAWTTRGVLSSLGLLMCAGILWSKRRFA